MTYNEYAKKFKQRYGGIFTIKTQVNEATQTLRIFILSGPPIGWNTDAQKETGFMSISSRGFSIFSDKWDDRESFQLFASIALELENDTKALGFAIDMYAGSPGTRYKEEY